MKSGEIREQIAIEHNGQKIFGVIHRPLLDKKTPAVLICHGLGGNKIGKHRVYVNLAERLAKAGITALRIDFRGSGDSEGDFADMTIDSEVSDALKALEYLKNDPQVDHNRIALFGRSFGGVVAVSAANKSKDVKCLVLWAPVFSGEPWKAQWEMLKTAPIPKERKDELMSIDGMQPGLKFFEQLLALNLKNNVISLSNLPILHIHGEQDTLVTTQHADQYAAAREQAEGKSKFIRYPKSDHDFSNTLERNTALEESVDWFKSALQSGSEAN